MHLRRNFYWGLAAVAATLFVFGVSVDVGLAQSASAAPGAAPNESSPGEAGLKVFDPSLIDTAVDPCDNFYKYACNGWFKKNPLPADEVSYGRFSELAEINRAHLRSILEAAAAPSGTRTANEQKIGDEYASCMDVAAINAKGTAPLQAGAGPHCGADGPRKQLPALLAHLHRDGRERVFRAGSDQDFADATQVISDVWRGRAGPAGARLLYCATDAKSVEQRQQYVEHVAKC